MKPNKDYPGWALWVWDKGPYLFLGGGLLILIAIIASFLYFDHRIDQFGSQLQFGDPTRYETPDLSGLAVDPVELNSLAIQQSVYVPVYSHVYYQGGSPFSLEATLSIRNTDASHPIYVSRVNYFDTSGQLVESFLKQPIRLSPLQTIDFLVANRDNSGGSGANFLVTWMTDQEVNRPLVEVVMVGVDGPRGIAFGREGVEVQDAKTEGQ